MIIWGSKEETLDLGIVKEEKCKLCEKKRPFRLYVIYRWWHLYWIFGVLTKVRYMVLCEICSNGWEIDKKDIADIHKQVPIPFRRRYGLLSFGILLVFFIIIGAIQQ